MESEVKEIRGEKKKKKKKNNWERAASKTARNLEAQSVPGREARVAPRDPEHWELPAPPPVPSPATAEELRKTAFWRGLGGNSGDSEIQNECISTKAPPNNVLIQRHCHRQEFQRPWFWTENWKSITVEKGIVPKELHHLMGKIGFWTGDRNAKF